jgi:hypothetical protein
MWLLLKSLGAGQLFPLLQAFLGHHVFSLGSDSPSAGDTAVNCTFKAKCQAPRLTGSNRLRKICLAPGIPPSRDHRQQG